MKLYIHFNDADDTRIVVLCDADETVGDLRKQISADFHAVFPGRPPLCFFRMSSPDGFFLTDAARIGEVLEDNGTVECFRADAEASGAPLPEKPSPADVKEVLKLFQSQVQYATRAACHAAVRGGSKVAQEAMSVVLAILLLEGQKRPEARLEALTALQSGLLVDGAAALPSFIACGGFFVLLHLLSPSTKMDTNPDVVEGAARLLEQLASEHGSAVGSILQDCNPATMLQKLALDSRCSSTVKKRALAVRRLLEPSGVNPPTAQPVQAHAPRERGNDAYHAPPGRPDSRGERSDRLYLAGAAVLDGGAHPSAPRRAVSQGPPRDPGKAYSLNLRVIMDSSSDAEHQRQALSQLERDARGVDGLRGIARCRELPEALAHTMRDSIDRQTRTGALASLTRVIAKVAGDHAARSSFSKRLGESFLHTASSDAGPTNLILEVLRRGWLFLPSEFKPCIASLVVDALKECGYSAATNPPALASAYQALLDGSMPEELQVAALQGLNMLNSSAGEDPSVDAFLPQPKVANAALVRLIPQQPLLCLDVLAALSLKDRFRAFFGTQTSLLSFLAYCCHQPESAAASAAGAVQPLPLQRSAARCVANLSSHPSAYEWMQQARPLREACAQVEDLAVSTYLSMALGIDQKGKYSMK